MIEEKLLNNKKILFLAPCFFGYEEKIQAQMEKMGAKVDFYNERSIIKAFDRALLKILPTLFTKRSNSYFQEILMKNKKNDYNYIFVIKCDMLTEDILQDFRKTFPNAVFCLYLYDSVKNIRNIRKKFKYFDRILSFDRQDTIEYADIKFRPLFYIDEFKCEPRANNNYTHDISFCGTIHSDRFTIIKEVTKICQKMGLKFYKFSYLQSKFIYYFYKFTKRDFLFASRREFSFDKMNSSEIAHIVNESRTVLDIQHPKQSGLTMRTIEMLGMNKKLVTTNTEIIEYDFYNPQNILVIDRKNINISKEFLVRQYEPLEDRIYKKYSITTWIQDVLYDIK